MLMILSFQWTEVFLALMVMPFSFFEVHGVHGALLDLLVGAEDAAFLEEFVDEGGFAVVDVGDNGDIADVREKRGGNVAFLSPIGIRSKFPPWSPKRYGRPTLSQPRSRVVVALQSFGWATWRPTELSKRQLAEFGPGNLAWPAVTDLKFKTAVASTGREKTS